MEDSTSVISERKIIDSFVHIPRNWIALEKIFFIKHSICRHLGLSQWPSGEESACNARDLARSQFQLLCQEYPLKKEVAIHCSILAYKIPWRRSLWATVHGDEKE